MYWLPIASELIRNKLQVPFLAYVTLAAYSHRRKCVYIY